MKLVGIQIKSIIKQVSEETRRPLVSVSRAANTIGVATAFALLGIEAEKVMKAIEMFFAGKRRVIEPNIVAVKHAYKLVEESYGLAEPLQMDPSRGGPG